MSFSFQKIIFSLFIGTLLSISLNAHAEDDAAMKAAATNLCSVLKAGDRVAFEALLDAGSKNELRWWWDASGKGKDFVNIFDRCEFEHIDPNSTADQKKVFIQRFNKGDGKPWGRPAPVTFKKNAQGEWKISSYSL